MNSEFVEPRCGFLLPAPCNQAKYAKAGTEEQQGPWLRHLGGVPVDKEVKVLAIVVVSKVVGMVAVSCQQRQYANSLYNTSVLPNPN